jgi:hypothetical protein
MKPDSYQTSAHQCRGFWWGFGEVVGCGFGGGQGLASGLDRDGAVAACDADEFLDAPAGLVFYPVADGQRGVGFVALERLHGQREPGSIGEQPNGDLRY